MGIKGKASKNKKCKTLDIVQTLADPPPPPIWFGRPLGNFRAKCEKSKHHWLILAIISNIVKVPFWNPDKVWTP